MRAAVLIAMREVRERRPVLAAALVATQAVHAQDRRDGAVFAEKKDARYDAIKAEVKVLCAAFPFYKSKVVSA